jgi:hypothetical protein
VAAAAGAPDAFHHLITTIGRDIKQPHDHGTRHTGPPTINLALHHHKINFG